MGTQLPITQHQHTTPTLPTNQHITSTSSYSLDGRSLLIALQWTPSRTPVSFLFSGGDWEEAACTCCAAGGTTPSSSPLDDRSLLTTALQPTRPPRPSSKDSAVPQRKPIRKSPRTATPPSALVPLPPRTPLVTRPRRRSTLASPRPTSRTSKLLVSAHEQLLRNIVRIPGG